MREEVTVGVADVAQQSTDSTSLDNKGERDREEPCTSPGDGGRDEATHCSLSSLETLKTVLISGIVECLVMQNVSCD